MMNRKISQQDNCIFSLYISLINGAIKKASIVTLWIAFLLLIGIGTGVTQTISFTGDAEADFSGVEGVFALDDTLPGFPLGPDVGQPPGFPFAASGWDIKSVYFLTDLQQLYVGVDYFGIAGDADGDGNPSSSSPELTARGGQDLPDMRNSETFSFEIDLDQDGTFDIIAGVPGGHPSGFPQLGCTMFDIGDCFGLYTHTGGPSTEFGRHFASLIDSTNTLFASPSAAARRRA